MGFSSVSQGYDSVLRQLSTKDVDLDSISDYTRGHTYSSAWCYGQDSWHMLNN